jgi:type VII secretion effector (TIGR04197 family)
MIKLNEAEAQNHATQIGIANDQLTLSRTVTFSSSTTVSGNRTAEDKFQQLKKTPETIQQLLNRDITSIQSAVAAFKRADQQTKQLFTPLP